MLRKTKPIGYLITVPADSGPDVIESFTITQDVVLKKITVNVFDDVDGTAGIRVLIGSEYTIPDTDQGDGWFTGDNTTLTVEPEDEITKGTTIYIIGQNNHSTLDKHFYILFEFKYPEKKEVKEDASADN